MIPGAGPRQKSGGVNKGPGQGYQSFTSRRKHARNRFLDWSDEEQTKRPKNSQQKRNGDKAMASRDTFFHITLCDNRQNECGGDWKKAEYEKRSARRHPSVF
jgi:hypothetical protein